MSTASPPATSTTTSGQDPQQTASETPFQWVSTDVNNTLAECEFRTFTWTGGPASNNLGLRLNYPEGYLSFLLSGDQKNITTAIPSAAGNNVTGAMIEVTNHQSIANISFTIEAAGGHKDCLPSFANITVPRPMDHLTFGNSSTTPIFNLTAVGLKSGGNDNTSLGIDTCTKMNFRPINESAIILAGFAPQGSSYPSYFYFINSSGITVPAIYPPGTGFLALTASTDASRVDTSSLILTRSQGNTSCLLVPLTPPLAQSSTTSIQSSSTQPPTPSATSNPPPASSKHLSSGGKAGIAIGVIAFAALLFLAVLLRIRRRAPSRDPRPILDPYPDEEPGSPEPFSPYSVNDSSVMAQVKPLQPQSDKKTSTDGASTSDLLASSSDPRPGPSRMGSGLSSGDESEDGRSDRRPARQRAMYHQDGGPIPVQETEEEVVEFPPSYNQASGIENEKEAAEA